MTPPAWTRTPPSEPGWYWARLFDEEPFVVEVRPNAHDDPRLYGGSMGLVNAPIWSAYEWSGPLAPPS